MIRIKTEIKPIVKRTATSGPTISDNFDPANQTEEKAKGKTFLNA